MVKLMKVLGVVLLILAVSGCVGQGAVDDEPLHVDSIWALKNLELRLEQNVAVKGVIKTGLSVGTDHCSEGFYLSDATGIIQLRVKFEEVINLFSDTHVLDERVEVEGKYPVQEFFCEALICECDDFMRYQTFTTQGTFFIVFLCNQPYF
jgi:hypothetical protein